MCSDGMSFEFAMRTLISLTTEHLLLANSGCAGVLERAIDQPDDICETAGVNIILVTPKISTTAKNRLLAPITKF